MAVAAVAHEERRLTVAEVINALVADGLVPRAEAERLVADRRAHRAGSVHPLVVAADQKWRSALPPHKLLTLDALTEWYAPKTGLAAFHLDCIAKVPNASAEAFNKAAQDAKAGCPISRLLNTEITLSARLA